MIAKENKKFKLNARIPRIGMRQTRRSEAPRTKHCRQPLVLGTAGSRRRLESLPAGVRLRVEDLSNSVNAVTHYGTYGTSVH